jgi:hypothetical protein
MRAARRFQDPPPERSGGWWYIRIREDVFENGVLVRKLKRIKVAPADMPARQVQRLAAEKLRPVNQGLITAGSAVSLKMFIDLNYIPGKLKFFRKPSRDRSMGIIDHYLIPKFGTMMLNQLTFTTLQQFLSGLDSRLSFESRDKIRDVLGSIMSYAVKTGFLITKPTVGLAEVRRGMLNSAIF